MRRKNLLLTLWLLSPITIVALLMVLIFVTLDKDKLMADAEPYGAGAGDTGDANAIGQWLAGRDPDAVSLATRAKRERLMIAPSDWPGGVRLSVPASALPGHPEQVYLTVIHRERGRYTTLGMTLDSVRGVYELDIDQKTLRKGERIVVATSPPSLRDDRFVDDRGRVLRVLWLTPELPPPDAHVEDPLPVYLPIDSVYADDAP